MRQGPLSDVRFVVRKELASAQIEDLDFFVKQLFNAVPLFCRDDVASHKSKSGTFQNRDEAFLGSRKRTQKRLVDQPLLAGSRFHVFLQKSRAFLNVVVRIFQFALARPQLEPVLHQNEPFMLTHEKGATVSTLFVHETVGFGGVGSKREISLIAHG